MKLSGHESYTCKDVSRKRRQPQCITGLTTLCTYLTGHRGSHLEGVFVLGVGKDLGVKFFASQESYLLHRELAGMSVVPQKGDAEILGEGWVEPNTLPAQACFINK